MEVRVHCRVDEVKGGDEAVDVGLDMVLWK